MSDDRHRERLWWSFVGTVIGCFVLFAGGCAVLISHVSTQTSGSSRLTGEQPSPAELGTAKEVGSHGDDPNPDALYHGAFPSDDQTQERRIGGPPARFSGYTTWVRSARRVPATPFTNGYSGAYLRVRVTVFNRDTQSQSLCACDFYVWTHAAGRRAADVVRARTVHTEKDMPSGQRVDGDVYLYVGTVRGPYYVIYDPDFQSRFSASTARGVWRVRA